MSVWKRVISVAAVAFGVLSLGASGDSSAKKSGDSKPSNDSTPAADSGSAVDDVTISSCALPPDNQFLGPQANITVTNRSSKASNYIITIAFNSPDGSQQLDTATAIVNNLSPNQTAKEEASSLKGDLRKTSPKFTCKVVSATRYAS